MKEGLLICSGEHERKNIGDYIQSVAAARFYNHVDCLVERECLDSYRAEKTKVIMNGWFMHHPEHWPPSEDIKPLLVSFHIVPRVAEKIFSTSESIAFFKHNEPIGCRDYGTLRLLSSKGFQTYFSGCLT
ncbi:hypothetical protein, partial [Parasutterella secunda]|uniref:hypothetical protein n=1 Tax=Parasutterella secunda TaxID=626947 RepID=UPI0025A46F6B